MPAFAGMTPVVDVGNGACHGTLYPNLSRHAREGGHPVNSDADDFGIEVDPVRILFFDEAYLPRAVPGLETFLAHDRLFDIIILLIVDQPRDVVLLGEPANELDLCSNTRRIRSFVTPM